MLSSNSLGMNEDWDAVVIGAGAAGVFAALRAKECSPGLRLLLLEASGKPLRKVAISGGGRCNVTHACHDLDWLLSCYPRGGPRLEAILGRFMPEDTVRWFQEQGVKLKTESDGRMFPVTDSSQTIIDCLLDCAKKRRVELRVGARVKSFKRDSEGVFVLRTEREKISAGKVLLATGGASRATSWLEILGHTVVPDIPSLFTFCCRHRVIDGLQGIAVENARLSLQVAGERFEAQGPMLITHWGLSGPAVLKLSAFAARALHATDYQGELSCDLLPELSWEQLQAVWGKRSPEQAVMTASPFPEIPKRFWQSLVAHCGIATAVTWKTLPQSKQRELAEALKNLTLAIKGKGAFKEEFVTAGGLPLREIDPYTMESRKVPGLYIAGELLDVDGVTGGFNFQNAWATGYIAGEGLSV